jgi:hypothetical protein
LAGTELLASPRSFVPGRQKEEKSMAKTKYLIPLVFLGLAIVFATRPPAYSAQQISYHESKRVIDRIEKSADRFKSDFRHAIHHSGIDSATQASAVQLVKEFEDASDILKHNYDKDNAASPAAEAVLRSGAAIDRFMATHPLNSQAQQDWRTLRTNLDELAQAYRVAWTWPVIVIENRPAVAEEKTPAVILEQPRAVIVDVPYSLTHEQMEGLLKRLEDHADVFKGSLSDSLDKSRFDDTSAEGRIKSYVKDFEEATDRLKDRYSDKNTAVETATDVLRRAAKIDEFMRLNRMSDRAQADWASLRRDLDELAAAYNGTFDWSTVTFVVR